VSNVYCLIGRAASSTRVLEYYLSSKLLENFLLLEYSLLSISGGYNFHFRLQFLQSVDDMLEFIETLRFAISFATCHPGSRSECIHVEVMFVEGPDHLGPRYTLTHHLFFVIGSFC